MTRPERTEIINSLIEDGLSDMAIRFIWWLKKNPKAFDDFKKEKVCANDLLDLSRSNKKYKTK